MSIVMLRARSGSRRCCSFPAGASGPAAPGCVCERGCEQESERGRVRDAALCSRLRGRPERRQPLLPRCAAGFSLHGRSRSMRCWVDVAGLLPSRTVSRCRSVSPVGSLRLPGRAARRVSRACPGSAGLSGTQTWCLLWCLSLSRRKRGARSALSTASHDNPRCAVRRVPFNDARPGDEAKAKRPGPRAITDMR